MTRGELVAWCAGLFEGEGSIHCGRRSATLQLSQVDREPLDRFASVFGGSVMGPYGPYSTQRQPYYLWQAQADKAAAVFEELAPFLSERRRKAWRLAVESQEARHAARN